MSKLSFDKNAPATDPSGQVIDVQATPIPAAPVATEIPASPVTAASAAPATTPAPGAVATRPPAFNNEEDISFDDIIVPRLNIVAKVGDLSNIFTPGEIVLNQELVVHTPTNAEKKITGSGPLVIIPIGFKKAVYVEKVKGGARGMMVKTREEVVSNGGSLDYQEWKGSQRTERPLKRFEPMVTGLFLVECPACVSDPDHTQFSTEIEGKFYSLACWSMKGTAYTAVTKRLFTARKMGFLKPTATEPGRVYASFAWTLTTEVKPFPGDDGSTNYVVVPAVTPGPKSSDTLVAFVKDGLGLN